MASAARGGHCAVAVRGGLRSSAGPGACRPGWCWIPVEISGPARAASWCPLVALCDGQRSRVCTSHFSSPGSPRHPRCPAGRIGTSPLPSARPAPGGAGYRRGVVVGSLHDEFARARQARGRPTLGLWEGHGGPVRADRLAVLLRPAPQEHPRPAAAHPGRDLPGGAGPGVEIVPAGQSGRSLCRRWMKDPWLSPDPGDTDEEEHSWSSPPGRR